jgi:flagellar hook protein FlgE
MFQLNPTLLNTSSLNLEVVGNNITNSGVTGYKSSDFESALAGAVRSSQGAQVKGAKINLSQGSIVASVSPLSMAINGAGFFKVQKIDGSQTYTRDGSFQMDKLGFIINANGDKLIGFPSVATNAQGILKINTSQNPPQKTASTALTMNLPAEEKQISNANTFNPVTTSSFNNTTSSIVYNQEGIARVIQSYYRYEESKVSTAIVTAIAALAATGTAGVGQTALTVPDTTGLLVGQRITGTGIADNTFITAINTGTKVVTTSTGTTSAFTGSSSLTVGNVVAGHLTITVANAAGLMPGQRITGTGIADNTFIASNYVRGSTTVPITAATTAAFTGTTTVTAPAHWEAYIYSDTQQIAQLSLMFNTDGTINKDLSHSRSPVLDKGTHLPLTVQPTYEWIAALGQLKFTVPAAQSGGAEMAGLPMDFSDVTKYAGDFTASSVQTGGYPPGALLGISVERDGKILARYGNGQQQVQAGVMLASFKNPNGLEVARDNQFLSTLASGVEDAGKPGQYGTGAIEGSSVEQSNVDLTGEMIKLIAAQRNYQAVAQLIKKQDEVLQTAINIGQ